MDADLEGANLQEAVLTKVGLGKGFGYLVGRCFCVVVFCVTRLFQAHTCCTLHRHNKDMVVKHGTEPMIG